MDMENVFNQNVDFLIQARDEVVYNNQLEQQQKQLKEKEDKMRKAISQEEKSIHDEIATTIKKRKAEIESTYDNQLDASRKKVKKAQDKKDKEKSERVGQRVDEETAGVKENSRELKTELKTLFKKNHVPAFCQTSLYYVLFMPKGFKEIFFLLLLIIIGLAGLPFGIYMLFSQVVLAGMAIAATQWFMAVVIAAVIIIVLGLYFLIFNLTKVKHRDTIAEGRKIRNQIIANEKNIKAIKNAINKDKDESQYGLGAYDAKIEQFQSEMDAIASEKQAAMKEFEKNTKAAITDEINGRRLGKLEEMKRQEEAVEEERNQIENQIKEVSIGITNKYAKYLGKNICKEDVLNDIIHIMETEQIETISEGIAIYKGEAPHKVQATEGE
ncbi:MAG: hypothetical protein J6K43_06370 [Lachnospiraceae bacterium]|nr:hypothetical protein [Lachnospiraceae bacterium]